MGVSPESLKIVGMLIVMIAVFVVVPLTIVFTEHQRKMMKLLRGQNDQEPSLLRTVLTSSGGGSAEIENLNKRVEALENEIAYLKAQSQDSHSDELTNRIASRYTSS